MSRKKKNSKKKGGILVYVLVIFALLALMGAGFAVYTRQMDDWTIPAAEDYEVKATAPVTYEEPSETIYTGGVNLIDTENMAPREDNYKQMTGTTLTAKPEEDQPEGVKSAWRGNKQGEDYGYYRNYLNNKVSANNAPSSGTPITDKEAASAISAAIRNNYGGTTATNGTDPSSIKTRGGSSGFGPLERDMATFNDTYAKQTPDTEKAATTQNSSGVRTAGNGTSIRVSFDWNLNADQMGEATRPGAIPYPFPQSENDEGLPYVRDTIVCTSGKAYGDGVGRNGSKVYDWPDIPYGTKVYGYYFKGWAEGSQEGAHVTEYSTVMGDGTRTLYGVWATSPYSDYRVNHWVQLPGGEFSDRSNIESYPDKTWRVGEVSGGFCLYSITAGSAKTGTEVQPKGMEINGYTSPARSSQSVREPTKDGASTVFNYFYGIDQTTQSQPGQQETTVSGNVVAG